MTASYVLGISAFYHDSAACLLRDGDIAAAAQEERFTRKKGDASFPRHAVRYCLQAGDVRASDVACVGFYDKPLLSLSASSRPTSASRQRVSRRSVWRGPCG